MNQRKNIELGPDWRPISEAEEFRNRRLKWGLGAAVAAAAGPLGLVFIIYQIQQEPFGLWWVVSLWGITMTMAIALKHQATVVMCSFRRPNSQCVVVSLYMGLISLLAGLVYWKLVPLHQAFPVVPVFISFPLSLFMGLVGLPVFLADVMNNLEARISGHLAAQYLLQGHALTAHQDLLEVDVDPFQPKVIRALRHDWRDPKNTEEGTSLKYGLFLAVKNGLRNQCILYGQRLISLYEKDMSWYLVKQSKERFDALPKAVNVNKWVLNPLEEYFLPLDEHVLEVGVYLIGSGADGLWVGCRRGHQEPHLVAQVGDSFIRVMRIG